MYVFSNIDAIYCVHSKWGIYSTLVPLQHSTKETIYATLVHYNDEHKPYMLERGDNGSN